MRESYIRAVLQPSGRQGSPMDEVGVGVSVQCNATTWAMGSWPHGHSLVAGARRPPTDQPTWSTPSSSSSSSSS